MAAESPHGLHPTDLPRRRARFDSGTTLIEIIITIVIIGSVVAGTMASLQASIIAGTRHRDHSNAHGWLQSASDMLYAAPKVTCDSSLPSNGEAAIRAAYDDVIEAVANPQGWAEWQIRVVSPVLFWNADNVDSDPDIEYFFSSACDPSLTLQLVRLEVRNTNGTIIESVEIVK